MARFVPTDEEMLLQNTISECVCLSTPCKTLTADYNSKKAQLLQMLLENKEIERPNAKARDLEGSTSPPESSLGSASAPTSLVSACSSPPAASSTMQPAPCHGPAAAFASDRRAAPEAGHFVLAEALRVYNLPSCFTCEQLLQVWPADQCQFDFVYLPYNTKRRRFNGYAFINFSSRHAAARFFEHWHGRRVPGCHNQREPLKVKRADVHGLEANLRHFAQNSGITNEKYLPAVFQGAVRVKIQDALATLRLHRGLRCPTAEQGTEEGAPRQSVSLLRPGSLAATLSMFPVDEI